MVLADSSIFNFQRFQSSVLGPLLFIIFVDNICHLDLKSFLDLFADDSTASHSSSNIKGLFES